MGCINLLFVLLQCVLPHISVLPIANSQDFLWVKHCLIKFNKSVLFAVYIMQILIKMFLQCFFCCFIFQRVYDEDVTVAETQPNQQTDTQVSLQYISLYVLGSNYIL